ncbi:sigma-70 family RNA polymerase sigma factor [Chryseomicrobium palamuruense]|uniref:Sigma-70 family RNA polymerase sigma factor n=1 Tax=Chryseomicrobium palamuruense TaxID=682973 RepID=A0ABV8USH3_9BACL
MFNSEEKLKLDFEKMVDNYGEALMRLAFTYVKNRQVAEDIVQDVFIRAYEKIDDFRGESSYQTYLYRMTVNRCHDHFRSWSFRNLIFSDKNFNYKRQENSVETEMLSETVHNVLGEEILSLPLKYREVIVFHYYKEYSINQIANILAISTNTVKTRLRRAKAKLKEKMSDKVGDRNG